MLGPPLNEQYQVRLNCAIKVDPFIIAAPGASSTVSMAGRVDPRQVILNTMEEYLDTGLFGREAFEFYDISPYPIPHGRASGVQKPSLSPGRATTYTT
jgi:hypothetical protein